MSGARWSSRQRWEPWRDWAAIALATHGVLLAAVLWNPPGAELLVLALPLGLMISIGTLTVLHDAGHRMFSPRPWVNAVAVQLATPGGLWAGHWTLKHKVHHKFSQIYPYDESTHSSSVLRLHPSAPVTPALRYQHVYAWPLYCLAWVGEFRSQLRFLRSGQISGLPQTPVSVRTRSFVAEKALCLAILAGYAVGIGVLRLVLLVIAAETVASVVAALVLVVGHINRGLLASDDPDAGWAENLMMTTASFATGSTVARWLSGGMTHHLAHHLRPVAVRSQLPLLHDTVAVQLAQRTGLPIVEFPSFRAAVVGHRQRLRELSTEPVMHVAPVAPVAPVMPPPLVGAGDSTR